MPKKGDKLITTLKTAHLGWGLLRYTDSRSKRKGEAYLQIPKTEAKRLKILNSRSNSNAIYNCNTSDGYIKDKPLLASGNSKAGDVFAKQLAGYKNLKLLGYWYKQIGAKEGDNIEILWISPTDILITKL